jgi:hypothetical protein
VCSSDLHEVHGRAHAVLAFDVVHAVDLLGIIEDPFREGGLPGINMGADADVADPLDGNRPFRTSIVKDRL